MKSHCCCLVVASVVFMLAALGHLARLVMGWKVVIGDWSVPSWVSVVAIVICVGLSAAFWMCSCCKGQPEAVPPQPKA
jgi:hypothetical protein